MDMTAKKEKSGLHTYQWLSIMLTLLALGGSIFYFIMTMEKRITLNETQNAIQAKQIEAMQQTLTVGMQLRIELQSEVKGLSKSIDTLREENAKSHDNIIRSIERLSGYKALSLIKKEPDNIP